MSLVDSIIKTAQSYIGMKEYSPQHEEILERYYSATGSRLSLNDPWCAAFVVAVFQKCGAASIIPHTAWCDSMIEWFKSRGQWHDNKASYSPKKGDIVFYDWDGKSPSDHTGIVVHNQMGDLSVIEGNKSDTVGYRNLNHRNPVILGYGTPAYNSVDSSEPVETPAIPLSPYNSLSDSDKSTVRYFPLLYEGSKGIWVKILQALLVVFDSGDVEIDGEFGPITKKWVMHWQQILLLEVDGIVGKETWSSFFAG